MRSRCRCAAMTCACSFNSDAVRRLCCSRASRLTSGKHTSARRVTAKRWACSLRFVVSTEFLIGTQRKRSSGDRFMPLLIALTAFIQAFFLFHVFRNGKPYWWALLILSTPVIGCIIYYLVEI